jgi:hypothetical protein
MHTNVVPFEGADEEKQARDGFVELVVEGLEREGVGFGPAPLCCAAPIDWRY